MAAPTTDSFANFKIWIGSSDSPGTYVAPCGFTNKALQLDADASATTTPDCDDPEAVAWEQASITVKRATVSASGVMAEESYETWRDWWDSGEERMIRVEKRLGYWQGLAICTSLGETVALGQEGNKIQLAVGVRNAADWTWVPVTP